MLCEGDARRLGCPARSLQSCGTTPISGVGRRQRKERAPPEVVQAWAALCVGDNFLSVDRVCMVAPVCLYASLLLFRRVKTHPPASAMRVHTTHSGGRGAPATREPTSFNGSCGGGGAAGSSQATSLCRATAASFATRRGPISIQRCARVVRRGDIETQKSSTGRCPGQSSPSRPTAGASSPSWCVEAATAGGAHAPRPITRASPTAWTRAGGGNLAPPSPSLRLNTNSWAARIGGPRFWPGCDPSTATTMLLEKKKTPVCVSVCVCVCVCVRACSRPRPPWTGRP